MVNIIVPDYFAYIFLGLLISTVILGLLMIIIYYYTGSLVFKIIKARFSKKPLLVMINKTRKVDFVIPKESEQLAEVKDLGYYILSPQFVYFLSPAGNLPIFFVRTDYALPLDADFAAATNKLKEEGIHDFKEAKEKDEQLKKFNKKLEIELPQKPTVITFDDIIYYTNTYISPIELRAQIDRKVTQIFERTRGINATLLFYIFLILIGAGIAYAIISNVSSSSTLQNKFLACEQQLAVCQSHANATYLSNQSIII